MLITGFPAGPPGTNCFVVAPGDGSECVVIDPGVAAEQRLRELLDAHRLKPVAVVLTHGHIDHTYSVLPVCSGYDIPAYIHPDDREQLADPWSGLRIPYGTSLFGVTSFSEPDEVRTLADGDVLSLAGVTLRAASAPGHTRGSTVFHLLGVEGAGTVAEPDEPVMFAGDLLFAGSIGRTDLPGGDEVAMFASLARVVLPLPDETVVLPGHGPETTIGQERAGNPYLRMAAMRAGVSW